MKFKLKLNRNSNIAWFPKKFATQAVWSYLIALVACSVFFFGHAMPIYLWLFGIVSVVLFFIGSNSLGRKWNEVNEKQFVKNVFTWGFFIRAAYVLLIYWLNFELYGKHFEVVANDAQFYQPCAFETAQLILTGESNGSIMPSFLDSSFGITDIWSYWMGTMGLNPTECGYQLYLSILYVFTGCISEFIIPLLMKALWGTLTCILIYKIAKRHFGENVARMAAIFCMLQMNMIWWCGSMMKETEMVLVGTWFVERMDRTLSGLKMKPSFILGSVLIMLSIFTFRAALFMVAVAATMLAIVITKSKTLSLGKKVFAGILIAAAMGFAVGDTIKEEVSSIVEDAQNRERVQVNMNWRTERDHGNQFAKYAGAAVFAPLIFTIPFPSLVYTYQGQEMQMQVSGGNYEKNVLSFFVILALLQLLMSGEWRRHVFPMAYMCGYIMALVLSEFAQSGRFHMPAMPFLMMFASYGITLITSKKHCLWFKYVLILEVGVCLAWSWFKLKGQGLI